MVATHTNPSRPRWRPTLATAALALGIAACAPSTSAERGTPPPPTAPHFEITGGTTTGPLRIERVELVFDNGFGSITVPQHSRLGATATLRFSGNGPLRAEWRADGRPIEQVNLIVTHGATLRLPLAPTTVVPTFEPGPHTLTLAILAPQPTFDLPTIRYLVTLDVPRR